MARNYVQPGETLTLVSPRTVAAGSILLVGGITGVALTNALTGQQVECRRVGVFDLPKATGQAWTQGQALYWDNTAFNVTSSNSGTTKIGAAAQAQASGDTVGRVLMNGHIA